MAQENGQLAASHAVAQVAGIGIRFTINHPEKESTPSTVRLHQRNNGEQGQEKFISAPRLIPLEERKQLLSEIHRILEKHGVPVERACITHANFHEEDLLQKANDAGKTHYSQQEILDISKQQGQNRLYVDFLAPLGNERNISAALQEINAIQRQAGLGGRQR